MRTLGVDRIGPLLLLGKVVDGGEWRGTEGVLQGRCRLTNIIIEGGVGYVDGREKNQNRIRHGRRISQERGGEKD